jgi:tRNA pseudouridine13 synthase
VALDVPEIERKLGIEVYATKSAGFEGVIRKRLEDFVVEEILVGGEMGSVTPSERPSRFGRYLVCVLVKRNWDTLLAIRAVARQLRIDAERIGFAGIKDTNAVTAQHISLYGVRPEEVERVKIGGIDVYPVRYADEKISTKLLFGNHFTLVIRSISLEKDKIVKLVDATIDELLALGGVPNFFGHQRFGTVRPVTHLVGKAIVKGDLEAAAFAFLACPSEFEHPAARKARERLGETRNFKEALSSFPASLEYERLMLGHLVYSRNDFLGAFKKLPLKLRELFVQAYQSFLFNMFLSERVRRGMGLNEVHVGDFVVFFDENGLPSVEGEKATVETVSKLDKAVKKGNACIAVPLVGAKQPLSDGVQGETERKILEEEDVKPEDFKRVVMPVIGKSGGLRAVLVSLIKFVVDKPIVDRLDANRCELRLRFVLPKGSYATVPLREFMKPQNPIEAGF